MNCLFILLLLCCGGHGMCCFDTHCSEKCASCGLGGCKEDKKENSCRCRAEENENRCRCREEAKGNFCRCREEADENRCRRREETDENRCRRKEEVKERWDRSCKCRENEREDGGRCDRDQCDGQGVRIAPWQEFSNCGRSETCGCEEK